MKKLFSLIIFFFWLAAGNAQNIVTEGELSEKQNDYYLQPTNRNGVGVKRSLKVSTLKDFVSKTKLENIVTKNELISFDGKKAFFDGSEWNLTNGNETSNGGDYAGTIIRKNSSQYLML